MDTYHNDSNWCKTYQRVLFNTSLKYLSFTLYIKSCLWNTETNYHYNRNFIGLLK